MFFSVLPVACWLPVLNIVKPETLIFPIASLHSIQSYEKTVFLVEKRLVSFVIVKSGGVMTVIINGTCLSNILILRFTSPGL